MYSSYLNSNRMIMCDTWCLFSNCFDNGRVCCVYTSRYHLVISLFSGAINRNRYKILNYSQEFCFLIKSIRDLKWEQWFDWISTVCRVMCTHECSENTVSWTVCQQDNIGHSHRIVVIVNVPFLGNSSVMVINK